MADHWKSLANLLGAPGVDLPEESEIETPAAEDAPVAEVGAQGEAPDTVDDQPETSGWASAESKPESKEEEVAPSSLSFQDDDASDSEEPEEVVSRPEVIQAVKPKVRESKKPASTQGKSEPEPSAKPARKSGKRSSWESLASMFNIKLESRSEPEEQDLEPEKPSLDEAPKTRGASAGGSKKQLEKTEEDSSPVVFNEADTRAEENPALTALFGDATSKPQSDDWYQKRRVIDDVGGWDDSEESERSPRAESYGFQSRDEDNDDLPVGGDDVVSDRQAKSESEGRRGRRRRGRGRGRGESASEDRPSEDFGARNEADTDRFRSGSWKDDEDAGVESVDELDEVERRSSRRRRRGRRPATAEERAVPEDARTAPETDFPVADELDETDEVDFRERKPSRRRRERPKRVPVSDSAVDNVELDEDSPSSSEDDEERAVSHRNIPTWEDALRSIIETNTDNHRKNESRGHRSRSRGRR